MGDCDDHHTAAAVSGAGTACRWQQRTAPASRRWWRVALRVASVRHNRGAGARGSWRWLAVRAARRSPRHGSGFWRAGGGWARSYAICRFRSADAARHRTQHPRPRPHCSRCTSRCIGGNRRCGPTTVASPSSRSELDGRRAGRRCCRCAGARGGSRARAFGIIRICASKRLNQPACSGGAAPRRVNAQLAGAAGAAARPRLGRQRYKHRSGCRCRNARGTAGWDAACTTINPPTVARARRCSRAAFFRNIGSGLRRRLHRQPIGRAPSASRHSGSARRTSSASCCCCC